jgi:hypothetical protein
MLSTKLSTAAASTLLLCCVSHLQHLQGVLCLKRCFANRLWQQVAVRVQRLLSTTTRRRGVTGCVQAATPQQDTAHAPAHPLALNEMHYALAAHMSSMQARTSTKAQQIFAQSGPDAFHLMQWTPTCACRCRALQSSKFFHSLHQQHR